MWYPAFLHQATFHTYFGRWMTFKEKVGVFETYDRARNGPRVDEKEWDRKITYQTANKLKEKYKLQFDRSKIIPLWVFSFCGNAFYIFLLRQFMKGIPAESLSLSNFHVHRHYFTQSLRVRREGTKLVLNK